MVMVAAYEKANNVQVTVFSESFEDIQPKASVSANTGQGPDLVWGLHSLPQLFPDKVIQMNDVADYLGKKYGGWTSAAAITCTQDTEWLGIPVATIGGYLNYRTAAMEKAGFKTFPTDFPSFLELCKALKKNNTPAGFALGHASGDANAWLHWVLWGHNAWLVDKDDKVIINSPETANALEYCKALSDTFISGCGSSDDSSNNKAFLAGDIFLTDNGISIYVAAKGDPSKKEIAEDMNHALFPGRTHWQADRTATLRSNPGVQLHQVSERGEGLYRVHAGEAELRSVAHRCERLSDPLPQRLSIPTRFGPWIRKTQCSRKPASVRCRRPASVIRASGRRQPSPTFWSSICSPITASAAKTSKVRSQSPSGRPSGSIAKRAVEGGRRERSAFVFPDVGALKASRWQTSPSIKGR